MSEELGCANGLNIARQSKHTGFDQHDDYFDCSRNARIHGTGRF